MKFIHAILLALLASNLGNAQELSLSNRLEVICRKLDERRSATEIISADSHVVLIEPEGVHSEEDENGVVIVLPPQDTELLNNFHWVLNMRTKRMLEFSQIQTYDPKYGIETSTDEFRGTKWLGTIYRPRELQLSNERVLSGEEAPEYYIKKKDFTLSFYARPLLLSHGWLMDGLERIVETSWSQLLQEKRINFREDVGGDAILMVDLSTETEKQHHELKVYLDAQFRIVREVLGTQGKLYRESSLLYQEERLTKSTQLVESNNKVFSRSTALYLYPSEQEESLVFEFDIPKGAWVTDLSDKSLKAFPYEP